MRLSPCRFSLTRHAAAASRINSRLISWRRQAGVGLVALIFSLPVIADVPAGSALQVRLLSSLSSYSSKTGDDVEGLLVAPGCPDGFPAGTTVHGVLNRVHKVGLGLVYESARLDVQFFELRLPDGQKYPLRARLTSVDNAREHVNRHGSIRGVRATASVSNRIASRMLFAVEDHPFILIPALVAESLVLRFPDPEIGYAPGTELYLELEDTVPAAALPVCAATRQSQPPPELETLIAGVPYWTSVQRNGELADPTNLIFIGSKEQIDRAFSAAGWTGSDSVSRAAGLQLARAICERHGYADAPMSTLLLDGAGQDISLQKSLNTVTKRHHLRIWKRPEEWQGRTLWASAAAR